MKEPLMYRILSNKWLWTAYFLFLGYNLFGVWQAWHCTSVYHTGDRYNGAYHYEWHCETK